MSPAVIVTKLSAISATQCEHVSAATEGEVWENVLRIIGCNAQSVASNHRPKLIGGFDFSQVGQLFCGRCGLFFFFSPLSFSPVRECVERVNVTNVLRMEYFTANRFSFMSVFF